MRSRFFVPVTLGLSIGAIFVGRRCAEGASHGQGRQPLVERSRTESDSGASTVDAENALSLARRGLVARCDTDVLWQYLIRENGRAIGSEEVYAELVDRLGGKAIEFAFTLPEGDMRNGIAIGLLKKFMEKDLGAAADLFVAHHDGLPPFETSVLQADMIGKSFAVSADEMIAICETLKRKEIFLSVGGPFAPGFDFRKALDYIDREGATFSEMVPVVVGYWAQSKAMEAVDWLLAHPDFCWGDESSLPFSGAGSPVTFVIRALASSSAPDRAEAFSRLMDLPEGVRLSVWNSIHGSQYDAEMLEAATMMGVRENFLQEALFSTCTNDLEMEFWDKIAPEERRNLLIQEQEAWHERESHTPLEETSTLRGWSV